MLCRTTPAHGKDVRCRIRKFTLSRRVQIFTCHPSVGGLRAYDEAAPDLPGSADDGKQQHDASAHLILRMTFEWRAGQNSAILEPRQLCPAPTAASVVGTDSRLVELDWLRIGAFGLLMFFHVGLFYAPGNWHVKSPYPQQWLQPVLEMSSPWRLSLLFLVAGAATGLSLGSRREWGQIRQRTVRLLVPLGFGMAIFVLPQVYLEVVHKFGYADGYINFLQRYLVAGPRFCPPEGKMACITPPNWNHLWFLGYLWAYTLLLIAVRLIKQGAVEIIDLTRLTSGGRLLWLPLLLFAIERQQLLFRFPPNNGFVNDWFSHALYLSMFLLGSAFFGHRDDRHGAWAAAVRLRWWALGAALLSLLGMRIGLSLAGGWQAFSPAEKQFWLALGAIRHWAPVLAALGFARLHLRGRDSRARRLMTEAVFPFYLVHQMAIVVGGHHLARINWPLPLEAVLIVVFTAVACFMTWRIGREVRWLRPLLGIVRRPGKWP